MDFDIKRVWRFVNERGNITKMPLPEFTQNKGILRKMYGAMVLTRVFDETCVALNRTGKLGTVASSYGQEAVGVGTTLAMKESDILVPTYRDQGAMMVRGVTPKEIFLFWKGDERGSDFESSADFPIAIPIGTQLLHAAGAAYAEKMRGSGAVVVTFVGDGGTSRGDLYEAMNFAGVHKLPVVFVINNNQYAISVPLRKQTAAKTLAQKGVAAGVPGVRVDGNDCIAMQHVAEEAIAHARNGRGPVVIEALTYRLTDHTTADDASRYRADAEVEGSKKREPIARMRMFLERQEFWNNALEKACKEECKKIVDTATEEMENQIENNPRAPRDPFRFLFEEMPTNVRAQQRACEEHEGCDK